MNADQIYSRFVDEWNAIPNEVIHNFYSSFKARSQECQRIKGEGLNRHWLEVTKEHNKYRTNLIYWNDEFDNQMISKHNSIFSLYDSK